MGGAVSARLDAVARRLTTIGDQVALAAADAVAETVTRQLAADGAPLSRYRGGGAPRVDTRRAGTAAVEVVPTSGAGQIGILESGARPHQITGRVLAFRGGGFARGGVDHPGAPARRTWSNGVDRGQAPARSAAADVFGTVLDG